MEDSSEEACSLSPESSFSEVIWLASSSCFLSLTSFLTHLLFLVPSPRPLSCSGIEIYDCLKLFSSSIFPLSACFWPVWGLFPPISLRSLLIGWPGPLLDLNLFWVESRLWCTKFFIPEWRSRSAWAGIWWTGAYSSNSFRCWTGGIFTPFWTHEKYQSRIRKTNNKKIA